jgi:hypothetical protein
MFDREAVLESNLSTLSHDETTLSRLTLGEMGGKMFRVFSCIQQLNAARGGHRAAIAELRC